jgi:hypothetical protein
MLSFCYVDRQKSSVGSSEKSQVVHSANWKEQVHLKKELQLLHRQKNEAIKRIASDQRMVTRKFLHRIVRSIDQIKVIEKMKEDIKQINIQRNGLDKKSSDSESNEEVCSPTPPSFPRLTTTNEKHKCRQVTTGCRRVRPATASELQGRAWERKIGLMAKNIQRSKSASDIRRRHTMKLYMYT